MKKSNPIKFFKSRSNLVINQPDCGSSNLQSDWFRESYQRRMVINGIPIKSYAIRYNNFKTVEDIAGFFNDVILKDSCLNDEEKKIAVAYLKKSFHQGGLMYPVSSALAVSFNEYDAKLGRYVPYATLIGNPIITLSIQTTKTGFKVEEICKVENLMFFISNSSGEATIVESSILSSNQGLDYVIEAAGTVNIDFSKSQASPSITIENNLINYGHSEIQKKFDHRTFTQRLIDFIKYVVGLNSVKDMIQAHREDEESMTYSLTKE